VFSPPSSPLRPPALAAPCRRPALAWTLLLLFAATLPPPASAQDRSGHLAPDFQALAKGAYLRLPPPPAWKNTDGAGLLSLDDLTAAFARVTSTPPQINHLHSEFLRPSSAWVKRYTAWFGKLERPLRMRFEAEQWDCDNYAACYVTFADLLTLRAGEARASLAVGWASVFYRQPFAGIPAGGAHAIVIIAASDGLYIIEPRDGTTIALEKFPNRDTIEAVYF